MGFVLAPLFSLFTNRSRAFRGPPPLSRPLIAPTAPPHPLDCLLLTQIFLSLVGGFCLFACSRSGLSLSFEERGERESG